VSTPDTPFDVPEDYEDRIEDARLALHALPRGEDRDHAERVLANAPGREQIEDAQRRAAEAMATLAAFQRARHTGHDPDRAVTVVLRAGGDLHELALGEHADRLADFTLTEAIKHAWAAAEAARSDGDRALGAARAEQILADIEFAVSAREHERFEAATEDGSSTIVVDLRGRLVDLVLLQSNVLGRTDRHRLAAQLTAAARQAQAAAAAVAGEIAAVHYAHLRSRPTGR